MKFILETILSHAKNYDPHIEGWEVAEQANKITSDYSEPCFVNNLMCTLICLFSCVMNINSRDVAAFSFPLQPSTSPSDSTSPITSMATANGLI